MDILHVDEDLVVVNKPPSIPVHPIGRFRVKKTSFIYRSRALSLCLQKNSVEMILREECPELLADEKCLKLVHRQVSHSPDDQCN